MQIYNFLIMFPTLNRFAYHLDLPHMVGITMGYEPSFLYTNA